MLRFVVARDERAAGAKALLAAIEARHKHAGDSFMLTGRLLQTKYEEEMMSENMQISVYCSKFGNVTRSQFLSSMIKNSLH
jgi:hypothetical protein